MLKDLLLKKRIFEKGYNYKEAKKDIIKFLLTTNDIELICLYVASNDFIDFNDLNLLIECAIINANSDNIDWIEELKNILLYKPKIIVYEFMEQIKELNRVVEMKQSNQRLTKEKMLIK